MSSMQDDDSMLIEMTSGMQREWGAGEFFFTLSMWIVMMIGMMAPSAAPMILLFAATRNDGGHERFSPATLAFVLGYLSIWAGFCVLATIAQWALHDAALLSAHMASASTALSGA